VPIKLKLLYFVDVLERRSKQLTIYLFAFTWTKRHCVYIQKPKWMMIGKRFVDHVTIIVIIQDLVHLSTNQTQSSEKNKAFVTNMAVAGRILSSQL